MYAESEAAGMAVRLVGQGISEVIRISGAAAYAAAPLVKDLSVAVWARLRGGVPGVIAKNPGGMAIVTIPTDKLELFQKTAPDYKFAYFTVQGTDYTDVCLKNEDLAVCQRVLEKLGIASVTQTASKVTAASPEEAAVASAKTFAEAKESLSAKMQTAEEAFNRNTSRDFSDNEPWFICDIDHPDKYVRVTPEKATFEGETYTKSTYTVFEGDNEITSYHDGRFTGREPDFWPKQRDRIMEASGMTDGRLVYFRNETSLHTYQMLYGGKDNPQFFAEVDVSKIPKGDLQAVYDQLLEHLSLNKEVPQQAQDGTSLKAASATGQKNTAADNTITKAANQNTGENPDLQKPEGVKPGGVKEFAESFKLSQEQQEISAAIKAAQQKLVGGSPS